ncbi:MAG TPA: thioredoxin [Ruminococcaceae bacterium]|nr:thioredoxin [Oscillospiraceae bacterium]
MAINAELFETEVLESDIPVVVDFWADWCGPCRMLSPIVEEVAEDLKGKVAVVKINVDEEQDLAQNYKIKSIPTLILFKKGEEAGRLVGLHSKADILKFVKTKK